MAPPAQPQTLPLRPIPSPSSAGLGWVGGSQGEEDKASSGQKSEDLEIQEAGSRIVGSRHTRFLLSLLPNGLSLTPLPSPPHSCPLSSHPVLVSPCPHLHLLLPASPQLPTLGLCKGPENNTEGALLSNQIHTEPESANAAVPHSLRLGRVETLGRKPPHASIFRGRGQTLAQGPPGS